MSVHCARECDESTAKKLIFTRNIYPQSLHLKRHEMNLITFFLLLPFYQSKLLWSLNEADSLLTSRKLSEDNFRFESFADIKNPFLFTLDHDALINLKPGSEISFEVPINSHLLERSCRLKQGFPGVPSKYQTAQSPTTLLLSCLDDHKNTLELIINKNKPGDVYGNYYTASDDMFYIDQAFKKTDTFIIYSKKQFLKDVQNQPEFLHEVLEYEDTEDELGSRNLQGSGDSEDILKYKIAILTSPQFADVQGDDFDSVFNFVIAALSRVNGILLRQAGIFIEPVDNFEEGICVVNDPRPSCALVKNNPLFREETRIRLDELGIPFESYDMAQLLISLGTGGIAVLNSVCSSSRKGQAVSDAFGLTRELGFFSSFMFAHEISHQLGARHTLRDCQGFNNGGNRAAISAVEPGSGSTLMSLGGSGCQSVTNIVRFRDEYLHPFSRLELRTNLERKNNCGERISTDTPQLSLQTIEKCTVPIGNNFFLRGKTETRLDDNHFFAWDRVDPGIQSFASQRELGRFRSYPPVVNRKQRFLINLHYLNFIQDDDFELLPTEELTMNFRFTERSTFQVRAQEDALESASVSSFKASDTLVEFRNGQSFSLNAFDKNIVLNQGFEVSWSSGSLSDLSPDQKVQFFFARNTMIEIDERDLVDYDYADDVIDLDWIFLKEVDLSDGNTCLEIINSDVNSANLGSFRGNLLAKVSTNDNRAASINNEANCFVFDLATDIRVSTSLLRNLQASCDAGNRQPLPDFVDLETSSPSAAPTDPPTTPPPTNPPTDPPTNPPTDPPTNPPTDPPTNPPTDPPTEPPSNSQPPREEDNPGTPENEEEPDDDVDSENSEVSSGDSPTGGIVAGVMVSLCGVFMILIILSAIRKRRKTNNNNIYLNDNGSLNSKKPKAIPLRTSMRWSIGRKSAPGLGDLRSERPMSLREKMKSISKVDPFVETFVDPETGRTTSQVFKPEGKEEEEKKQSMFAGFSIKQFLPSSFWKKTEDEDADERPPSERFPISQETSKRLERDPFPGESLKSSSTSSKFTNIAEGVQPERGSTSEQFPISQETSKRLERDPFPDKAVQSNTHAFLPAMKRKTSETFAKVKELPSIFRTKSRNLEEDDEDLFSVGGASATFAPDYGISDTKSQVSRVSKIDGEGLPEMKRSRNMLNNKARSADKELKPKKPSPRIVKSTLPKHQASVKVETQASKGVSDLRKLFEKN